MSAERQSIHLFLYGSLLTGTPDRRLNRRLRRLLKRARPATIQARLYNLGRYPGVIPSTEASDRVYGRVITLNNPHLLRQMDRYEDYVAHDAAGGEFTRVMVTARMAPQRNHIDCWAYLYNRSVAGKQRITSGDYVRYRKARIKWLS